MKVSLKPGGQWQTEWDIGTIDQDPRLSDDWFCRNEYEKRFGKILQDAANQCLQFELPGATSRWGRAAGMGHSTACELAHRLFAFWQDVILEYETGGYVGEEVGP